MTEDEPRLSTAISYTTAERITVHGHDLAEDVIGHLDFGSFVFLLLTGRVPTPEESTMTNAILVTIGEHGITPSVIASRLTLDQAPNSLQGAVASGLLGAGSTMLGTTEASGRRLQAHTPYEDVDAAARTLLEDTDRPVPGLGHFEHEPVDPRAERLFELAKREGFYGQHCRLLETVQSTVQARTDDAVPVNAAGAIASIASDMGLDWRLFKGFALISRTAGLVGHLREEIDQPMAREIWQLVDEHVEYTGPR